MIDFKIFHVPDNSIVLNVVWKVSPLGNIISIFSIHNSLPAKADPPTPVALLDAATACTFLLFRQFQLAVAAPPTLLVAPPVTASRMNSCIATRKRKVLTSSRGTTARNGGVSVWIHSLPLRSALHGMWYMYMMLCRILVKWKKKLNLI